MQSLSTEGVVLYLPGSQEYIMAYVQRPNWGVGNDTIEVQRTIDILKATFNPDYRMRNAVRILHPDFKELRVKVTRSVEVLTEELNFNLEPENKNDVPTA